MSWSVSLVPPPSERTKSTVRKYYAHVKTRHQQHCPDDESDRIDRSRDRALARCEDDQFFVYEHVYPALADGVGWATVADLMEGDDWRVDGDALETLLERFRTVTAELEAEYPSADFDYRCYSEIGPIALCEFALERGYNVRILD